MKHTLVIGATGFIGGCLAEHLRRDGSVVGTSRRHGEAETVVRHGLDLDRVLADQLFDQIIFTPQLTAAVDDLLTRIDGERWLVLSSAQLASAHPAPGTADAVAREATALRRGATVLRPTMVFGHGRDRNVTRLAHWLRRFPVVPVPGTLDQLVQPLHVDDLADLVARHRASPLAGRYDVAGPEQLTVGELLDALGDLLGARVRAVHLPEGVTRVGRRALGLREDQVARLTEDKVVDIGPTKDAWAWAPVATAIRLEQAVSEIAM